MSKVAATPAEVAESAEIALHTPWATFALRDALKDLRLALELYGRTGGTPPLTSATKELYERAAESAEDLDISAIATLYEGQPDALG